MTRPPWLRRSGPPPAGITKKAALEAHGRAVEDAAKALRDKIICDRCGATGATYDATCKAGPADDCPGFLAVQEARSAAVRARMG